MSYVDVLYCCNNFVADLCELIHQKADHDDEAVLYGFCFVHGHQVAYLKHLC